MLYRHVQISIAASGACLYKPGMTNPSKPVDFMKHLLPIVIASCAAFLAPSSLYATDQAQEYLQVRKIAMKDAHVQAAFQRAEEKLDERILEIDPSLKPYMDKRHGAAPTPKETKKAAPVPAPKHTAAHKPASGASATTHIIAKGETLSSIALQYKVSVASLKTANGITDERKLKVGQKLVIPSAKSSGTPAKKETGFWDKVKSNF